MNASEGAAESSPELSVLCAHDVLSNSDLFYVHFDERGCSVTLGFSRVHGNEGVEFFLRFHEVRDVRVRGWGAPGQKDVHVERATDGTVQVSASSEGSSLRFRAAGATLSRTRNFLAARSS
ncbi:Imm50 family immunity protein [Streptomyces sp. LE64]|uniref:Imm50 family immunity protein n=1 Tax=Streptomyces sp. LE64 TaxID=3448653 RepID=UPI004041263C